MVNELHLSGNELVCYAIIYGFSQDGKFWDGSLTYLSEWMGVSRRTAINVINSLITKGYIEKQDYEVNNVKFCKYRAIATNFIGGEKIALGGGEKIAPCINNNIYIKEERDLSLSKKDELFEKCWIAYRRKGKKCKSKPYWNKLKEEEKQRVLPHIKAYVSANELRFQQDFERYLRDKTFESIVIKGNDIIYDPACGMDAEYHPWGNASLMYNSIYKCYVYISYFDGTLCDGYTDDDRPDGASVVLNNGRGTIVWSKSERKWNLEHKSPWK